MGMPCLKIIKDYLLSQNLQQEAHRTKLLKFIDTLQASNQSTCIKPDTEKTKYGYKRRLYEFHDVWYQRHTVQCTLFISCLSTNSC